ncbi:MAG: lipid A biosynthesis lauroyl acyltransferase [Methylacidiphilales bacterium]|nr:lipid A biosynthesis lauroyl acyltransferase [Candidatus Methylacidiphilales bacterium]
MRYHVLRAKLLLARARHTLALAGLKVVDALFAAITLGALKLARRADPDRMSDVMGRVARRFGPILPVSRTGRANLRAAFPTKSAAEIEDLLAGCWENLGRVAGEFPHIDRLWDFSREHPNIGRIETPSVALYDRLRDDGKPALIFAAHLANWELPAVAAAAHGLKAAVLYRAPNNLKIAGAVEQVRENAMGTLIASGPDAVLTMAGVLERGEHLGMLVDQRFGRGVPVTFFGRRCMANPTIARLARLYPDVPVHGVRVIRLPNHRFRVELTEQLDLPRAKDGSIDVQASMQMITSIIEDWVRAYPEQWLWLHRRWR